jgi:hypothetical protein
MTRIEWFCNGEKIGEGPALVVSPSMVGKEVLPRPADGVEGDRLTAETLICCDHAHVADPACGLNGDGIATLGELIEAYDSPGGGVEPSREDNSLLTPEGFRRRLLTDAVFRYAYEQGRGELEARVVELEAALREAEAMAEALNGDLTRIARERDAALAAAGEGEDRPDRSIPDSEFFLNPREEYERARAAEARVVELAEALHKAADALHEAHEYIVDDLGGASGFGRVADRYRALAAAGEGEGRPPRSEPDPDQPFHPCACGGDHLTIDHPSGPRLPEPGEGEDPRCATCRDVGAAYCDDCSSRVRPDARSGSRLPKPLAAAGEGEATSKRDWACPAHGTVPESEVAWESHSQIPVHRSPCNRDVEPRFQPE